MWFKLWEILKKTIVLSPPPPLPVKIFPGGVIGASLEDGPSAAIDGVVTVDLHGVVGSRRVRVHITQTFPAVS